MTFRTTLLALSAVLLTFLAGCGGSASKYGASPQRSGGGYNDATATTASYDSDDAQPIDFADAEGVEVGAMEPPPPPMAPMAEGDSAGPSEAPPAYPQPAPAPAPRRHDGMTKQPPNKGRTATSAKVKPMLIYTANYTLAVYETTSSIDKVQALAQEAGGYLVRRNDRSITIRVPADKYRKALEGVSKIGDVLHHEESVEDVTEKFFDMLTRLDNAKAMRIRLQELLAAAKDVKDALAVERELARVTQTIETMEGKLKRMRELVNFSTITVSFNARGSETVKGQVNLPFPWLQQLGLSRLLRLR